MSAAHGSQQAIMSSISGPRELWGRVLTTQTQRDKHITQGWNALKLAWR